MVNSSARLSHDIELTERIIGSAYAVLNVLKPGLDEKLYERALVIALAKQGLRAAAQKSFPVHYEGRLIGTFIPHLIVAARVRGGAKVVSDFNDTHLAPVRG